MVISMEKYCSECGMKLRSQAKFCEGCGKRIQITKQRTMEEIEKDLRDKIEREYLEKLEQEFIEKKEKEIRENLEQEIQEKKRPHLLRKIMTTREIEILLILSIIFSVIILVVQILGCFFIKSNYYSSEMKSFGFPHLFITFNYQQFQVDLIMLIANLLVLTAIFFPVMYIVETIHQNRIQQLLQTDVN
jgi:hypothetical protein